MTRKNKPQVKAGKVAKSKSQPVAFHGDDGGNNHIVGFANLRVVLVPDGDVWFAQGLDIDYSAHGDTVEHAKRNFETGFSATVQKHLEVYGTIKNMLKVAPQEIWADLVYEQGCKLNRYTQVSTHNIIPDAAVGVLPFQGIDYLQKVAAA